MAHGWCFLLLSLGLCGLSSSVPRQFHVVKEEKNWTEAQQYCREEFTDLATIDNKADIDEIERVMQDAGVEKPWIGLRSAEYGNRNKWRWSLADRSFYRENEAEFRNWDEDQPNLGEDEEHVGIDQEGKWHDLGRGQNCAFVCYDETSSTHPYVLVEEEMKWKEAQSHCRKEYTDLASVRNQEENDKIKDLIREQVNSATGEEPFFWIGLFREAWEWSDGQNEVEFLNWGPNQPQGRTGEDCVSFKKDENEEKDGKWFDRFCNKTHAFVCYNETNSTHPFVLVEDRKNWADAQRYCREKHTDLVSVRNETENTLIKNLIQNITFNSGENEKVWIGLFRDAWEWSDGSSSSFRHWGPGEPNNGDEHQFCAQIVESRLWNDAGCYHDAKFICYDALPIVVVSPQPPFYSGDVVTLRCDITKYAGQHQYVWIKNNNTVLDETNQSITITLPEDAGQYQCNRRRNRSSVAPYISRPVNITANDLPNATVVLVSPQSPFYSGDDVTLKCNVMNYVGQHQYVWLKNSSTVLGKTSQTIVLTLPLEAGQYQCYRQRGNVNTSSVSNSVPVLNNDTLVLVKEKKSWKEALEYCREHHVDLVSVSSEQIQRWVWGWAKGASTPNVWLGLRYSCNLGFWFWVSGEIICYDNWVSNRERDQGCAYKVGAVRKDGKWGSFKETEKLNFICTKEGQWN